MLRAAWILPLVAAALITFAAARARTPPPYPRPGAMRFAAPDAVASVALVSLGMRRFAADLALIRVIVYYGTPEQEEEGLHEDHAGLGHEHHVHARGVYPELGPRALRILDLDPFWDYPVLYAAGALAFNQDRPEEAIGLVNEALRYRPGSARYLATIGAIGFHKTGDLAKVVSLLAPAVAEPDSPTMLKNMLAFMYVRLGRKREAVQLYREILLSRDENYYMNARRALERLDEGQKHDR